MDFAGHLGPIHAGHGEIHQEEVDLGLAVQEVQRRTPAAGLQHAIAEVLQDAGRHLAHGAVVVDQEDLQLLVRKLRGLGSSQFLREREVRGARQEHLHRGAGAGRAVDPHASARLLGEAEDLAQAEARPLADFLGGEEWLEDLGQHGLVHPETRVGHRDHHIVARRRFFRTDRLSEGDVAGLYRQGPADLHGVAGVDGEVEDDQLDLGGVDHRRPEVGLQQGLDPHAAAHGGMQKVAHAAHGVIQVHGPRLQPLAAREGQHLGGELGAALGGLGHHLQPTADRRIVAVGLLHLADVAQHHHQEVVEIVGDAGGELADGFQPLGLAQHGLDPLALGDLAGELAVGAGELGRALLHPALELGLAGADRLDPVAGLVLSPAAPERGLDHADQSGRMERPLQEGDVAQGRGEPAGGGIALHAAAAMGDQHDGQVGPGRLRLDPPDEAWVVGALQRLLRDQRHADSVLQVGEQAGEVRADHRRQARLAEDGGGDRRVPA